MPAGDGAHPAVSPASPEPTALTTFTAAQRERLRTAVTRARETTGLDVVLYLGALPSGRAHARGLLESRPEPAEAVVVAVDPGARRVEIVTGARAAEQCDDRACGLAAASMTASFAAGDLAGGLRGGLDVITDQARRVPILHAHEF